MRKHKSKVLEKLMVDMENDPWHVKLKRWIKLKIWVYTCLTRKYWDKSYKHYIFKSKKQKEEEDKQLYRDIETSIIRWSNHGRKTAGSLTREILKIINKK